MTDPHVTMYRQFQQRWWRELLAYGAIMLLAWAVMSAAIGTLEWLTGGLDPSDSTTWREPAIFVLILMIPPAFLFFPKRPDIDDARAEVLWQNALANQSEPVSLD